MNISIIIPFYNADKWIGRMLDSLLRQDMQKEAYEIIVVDDGSKDEPLVLKSYVQKHTNIIYTKQKNSGPGAARNAGLKIATGEYVFFCDSDDYVAENCLYRLFNIAHERSLDMLFFNVPRISESEAVLSSKKNYDNIQEYSTGKDFFALPIENGFRSLGPCQFIISRSFICEHHLQFPSDMIMNEDACFLIDAVLIAKKTAKVDADVYYYIQNPQSLIHYSGRILQAEKWATNRLMFITKLDSIIRNPMIAMDMPIGCLNNLIWLKNNKSYVLIRECCSTLPTKSFNRVLAKLISINSFPKPEGKHLFLKKIIIRPSVLKMINMLLAIKRK